MHKRSHTEPGSLDRQQIEKSAVDLLNRRALSSGLLVERLVRRGASPADAEAVAVRLVEVGAVDDRAYADMVLRSVTRGRPAGRSFLTQRLRREKLASEVIDAAVTAHLRAHDVEAEAIAWAQRQAARLENLEPERARRRLFGQLARRGFDSDVCRRAVASALGEEEA